MMDKTTHRYHQASRIRAKREQELAEHKSTRLIVNAADQGFSAGRRAGLRDAGLVPPGMMKEILRLLAAEIATQAAGSFERDNPPLWNLMAGAAEAAFDLIQSGRAGRSLDDLLEAQVRRRVEGGGAIVTLTLPRAVVSYCVPREEIEASKLRKAWAWS